MCCPPPPLQESGLATPLGWSLLVGGQLTAKVWKHRREVLQAVSLLLAAGILRYDAASPSRCLMLAVPMAEYEDTSWRSFCLLSLAPCAPPGKSLPAPRLRMVPSFVGHSLLSLDLLGALLASRSARFEFENLVVAVVVSSWWWTSCSRTLRQRDLNANSCVRVGASCSHE